LIVNGLKHSYAESHALIPARLTSIYRVLKRQHGEVICGWLYQSI
jgi:hypothetical protein